MQNLAQILSELGLVEVGVSSSHFVYSTAEGRDIGQVHEISGSRVSLKATCKLGHGRCVCWMSNAGGPRRHSVLEALLRWLRAGIDVSAAEHDAAAKAAKRSFGMRVRG